MATIKTEGSITKENITYASIGTYERLWDLRDYNFDSGNTKYFFRPTHVWYEVVIGRNVTYILYSFPLTINYMSIPTNYMMQILFLNQVCGNIKYDIRRECKCGFWSCIVFVNLLDQVYKFIDMPYYKFI